MSKSKKKKSAIFFFRPPMGPNPCQTTFLSKSKLTKSRVLIENILDPQIDRNRPEGQSHTKSGHIGASQTADVPCRGNPPSGTPDPPLPLVPLRPRSAPSPKSEFGVEIFSIKNRLFSILISISRGLAVVWTHFRSKK